LIGNSMMADIIRQSYNRRYGKRDKVITGDMGKETKL
jgi:hypothetical protein